MHAEEASEPYGKPDGTAPPPLLPPKKHADVDEPDVAWCQTEAQRSPGSVHAPRSAVLPSARASIVRAGMPSALTTVASVPVPSASSREDSFAWHPGEVLTSCATPVNPTAPSFHAPTADEEEDPSRRVSVSSGAVGGFSGATTPSGRVAADNGSLPSSALRTLQHQAPHHHHDPAGQSTSTNASIRGIGQRTPSLCRTPVVETAVLNKSFSRKGRLVINDYRLEGELGRGEYSVVHLAYHRKTKQPVAIKVLNRHRLARLNALENGRLAATSLEAGSVLSEIAVLKRLRHPNIIALLEVINDPAEKELYLVLELAEMGPLFELDADGSILPDSDEVTRLPDEEASRIAKGLLSAIRFAHHHGVAHRDIKPENILLNDQRQVKLADFGVSKMIQEWPFSDTWCEEAADLLRDPETEDQVDHPVLDDVHSPKGPTVQYRSAGTTCFMPPEFLQQVSSTGGSGQGVDVNALFLADIWSLGVTLYAITVGQLPWRALRSGTLLQSIREQPVVEFPAEIDISPLLADFLRRAIRESPTERCSLRELAHHPWITRIPPGSELRRQPTTSSLLGIADESPSGSDLHPVERLRTPSAANSPAVGRGRGDTHDNTPAFQNFSFDASTAGGLSTNTLDALAQRRSPSPSASVRHSTAVAGASAQLWLEDPSAAAGGGSTVRSPSLPSWQTSQHGGINQPMSVEALSQSMAHLDLVRLTQADLDNAVTEAHLSRSVSLSMSFGSHPLQAQAMATTVSGSGFSASSGEPSESMQLPPSSVQLSRPQSALPTPASGAPQAHHTDPLSGDMWTMEEDRSAQQPLDAEHPLRASRQGGINYRTLRVSTPADPCTPAFPRRCRTQTLAPEDTEPPTADGASLPQGTIDLGMPTQECTGGPLGTDESEGDAALVPDASETLLGALPAGESESDQLASNHSVLSGTEGRLRSGSAATARPLDGHASTPPPAASASWGLVSPTHDGGTRLLGIEPLASQSDDCPFITSTHTAPFDESELPAGSTIGPLGLGMLSAEGSPCELPRRLVELPSPAARRNTATPRLVGAQTPPPGPRGGGGSGLLSPPSLSQTNSYNDLPTPAFTTPSRTRRETPMGTSSPLRAPLTSVSPAPPPTASSRD